MATAPPPPTAAPPAEENHHDDGPPPPNDYHRSLHVTFLTQMKYTGLTDGKFYLDRFERLFTLITGSPPTTLESEAIDFLTLTLSEEPLPTSSLSPAEWFDTLPPATRTSYPALKRAFLQRYRRSSSSGYDLVEATNRLKSIVQTEPGEAGVNRYVDRFLGAYEDVGGDEVVGRDVGMSL
ncbi:hypothetical protein BJ508DRAFT_367832, partial [Ascobolus immersus RN42]